MRLPCRDNPHDYGDVVDADGRVLVPAQVTITVRDGKQIVEETCQLCGVVRISYYDWSARLVDRRFRYPAVS